MVFRCERWGPFVSLEELVRFFFIDTENYVTDFSFRFSLWATQIQNFKPTNSALWVLMVCVCVCVSASNLYILLRFAFF